MLVASHSGRAPKNTNFSRIGERRGAIRKTEKVSREELKSREKLIPEIKN